MKILLVNHRYFVSGGPERYMFSVKEALEKSGHEIVPFSIFYTRNIPCNYSDYFVSPLAGPDSVTFGSHRWTAASFFKTLSRTFYSREVERAVDRLIGDTQPDIAYVLHFMRKLSPSLLVGMKKRGLPIVVRLSDFNLLCPSFHLLRDNRPCTLCARGSHWPSVRYRCVQGSLGTSLVSFAAWKFHQWKGYLDLVDQFVVTNEFTLDVMRNAGWPENKLTLIHTPANPDYLSADSVFKSRDPGYILFSGQLEPHKGPDVLIRAYARALKLSPEHAPSLIMAGEDSSFAGTCRNLAAELGIQDRVEFPGFVEREKLKTLLQDALFTVIPSTCYENLPNVLIESFAVGTAIVGSGHGSIAPFIEEGVTGYLFKPGDSDSLAEKLVLAWENPDWCAKAGLVARRKASELFSMDIHMQKLLGLFTSHTSHDHSR